MATSPVIDASAMVELLIGGPAADAVARAVTARPLTPDVFDTEVLSALAGLARAGRIDARHGRDALAAVLRAPITRLPAAALLLDAWALRDRLSTYDALYVALARALDTTLVTADARLARAPGLGVPVTLVPASG